MAIFFYKIAYFSRKTKVLTIKLLTIRDLEEEVENEKYTLDELFQKFIKTKELEGLRERTIADHKLIYRYFKEFLSVYDASILYGDEITTETMRDYIYYMKNEKQLWENHPWLEKSYSYKKGLSPVTINVRLRATKCFFKFLYDEKLIKNNPCERIKLLKTENDLIGAFTQEQIKALLEQPDQRTFTGFRDYVIMLLMLDTGIRINEALHLKIHHFNYEQKVITVPGSLAKNTNGRILPLSKPTAKMIQILIKENLQLGDSVDYIFITNYGEQLVETTIRKKIKEYSDTANIKGVRVSPHTFRHTFAKYYILNGGDAFSLQRLLDHSTMNMVRKYIQLNDEDVKIQHNQFSPINNLI